MKKIFFFNFVLVLFFVFSCDNKENKIQEAEQIVSEIHVNFDKYSQDDWNKSDTIFSYLENDLANNREKYSPDQIENANKTIGRYKAFKVKKGINSLKKTFEDVGQQIQGAVEAFQDTLK